MELKRALSSYKHFKKHGKKRRREEDSGGEREVGRIILGN